MALPKPDEVLNKKSKLPKPGEVSSTKKRLPTPAEVIRANRSPIENELIDNLRSTPSRALENVTKMAQQNIASQIPSEQQVIQDIRTAPMRLTQSIREQAENQLVERPPYMERVKQEASKWPELLKPIGLAVEALAEAPFMHASREGLGTSNYESEGFLPVSGAGKVAGDVLNVVGVPLTVPGAGLGGGAIFNQAGNVVSKYAPKLGTTAGGRVAETAIKGAAEGVPLGVGTELALNPQASGRELALAAAMGGGGGAVLGGLGGGIEEVLRRYASRAKNPDAIESILSLPEPRQRGNVNTAQTPDIINVPETSPRGLPKPSERTLKQYQNAEEAASTIRSIDDELSHLNSSYQKAINDQYNLLRTQMKNRGGVSQGNVIRNAEGEVLSRFGRQSNNPGWYREFFAQNGRAPTNKELYKLAKQHVDEGYFDDGFQIPSWKEENNFDEVVQALTQVKNTLSESLSKSYIPSNPYTVGERVGIRQSAKRSEPPTARQGSSPEVLASSPEREVQETLQRIQEPRVRDRVYNYLDEAEKAARERLAKRRNIGFVPQGGNDVLDYAIIGAAKLGKGTIKFADWTEEMVKEFGEEFRRHAPRVYRQAKEYLRQQERRASKEGQDAIAFNESGKGDASTFDAKISRGPKKKKESFRQKWERLRTQLVDDLAPLEGLEKRVRGRVASAEDSLYKAARMFKGVPEKAAMIVERRLAPIFDAVEKAGYTADDLGRYALAKHAKDVNAAGYKSGFTNAEIEDVLRKYGSPEMEAAQQALVQVNRDMLQELVDSGVVSRELAEVLNERWKNYIPLFRAMDDDKVEFAEGLSKALANVASPIKALKGSELKVDDPFINMIKNVYRSTNAAERNKVASQLAKLADIDTDGTFIRRLEPDEQVGRKNVVNVKVNGENIKYEVEPEVYKALLNLDQESSNMIINILSKPASLLRAGATLTPEFSLRNPIRDIVQAFVVSKSGFNPLIDFPVGLIQAISKGKLYRDWVNNLGSYGNVMSMDRNVHQRALEKVLGEKPTKKFVNIVTGRSLIRLLRAISDTTESATKIGEYRAALRSGATPQEAAYRSRDIMDFARAGTGIRQANRIVAFLNANIQGKSKLIRAIKENPVGTLTRAFTAVTLPTVGIFAFNKQFANEAQKDTIGNAPDWMRNSFWLVAIPGTDTVARIPKPFDLAAIFSNLPERALDFVYENDKESFDGFVSQALGEAAIPVQISGLLPIIEGMSNYSFFRQGNIIPQRERNLAYSDQYDPVRTTETAKFLAKGAEKLTGGKGAFANFSSPRIMDNTIQGFTAGLGKYATDAIDAILQKTGAVDRPKAPSKRMEQQPLLRSFLVDPAQGGKNMDKFYEAIDELSKEKSSNRLNDVRFGGTKKNPKYLPKEKEKLLESLNKSSSDVSDINKKIREIEKSKTLSPQDKRRQIDVLIEERTKIIKGAVSLLK